MTETKQWTFGRTVLLIVAFLNLVIIATWLIVYYDQYEKIETVIKGIWGAILAVLGFLGYKTVSKKVSFATLIGTPPVNILIIVTFILNLIASAVIILWDFKIYTVYLTLPDLPDETDVTIIWKDIDTLRVTQKADMSWPFRLKQGDYPLRVIAEGYKPQDLSVHVSWPLEHQIKLEKFSALAGYLKISYEPVFVPVNLEFKENDRIVQQEQIQKGSSILQVEQGNYIVSLEANGYQSFSVPLKIKSSDTTNYTAHFKKIDTSGLFEIISRPDKMKIYLDNRFSGFETPHTFRLAPGQYKIELKKKRADNFGFYLYKNIRVRAAKKTKIDTTLNAVELCKLTLFPQDNNAVYFLDSSENNLGFISGPKTVFVFPGEHRFLKKIDDQVYYSETINVRESADNVIQF